MAFSRGHEPFIERKRVDSTKAVLKDIYAQYVSIPDEEKKEKVKLVQEFIKFKMIPLMKKRDVLFDFLFQEVYHTGSYFEGLRVNNANEFDINLWLRFPSVEESSLRFDDDGCAPGFATVKIMYNIRDLVKPRHRLYNNLSLFTDGKI